MGKGDFHNLNMILIIYGYKKTWINKGAIMKKGSQIIEVSEGSVRAEMTERMCNCVRYLSASNGLINTCKYRPVFVR